VLPFPSLVAFLFSGALAAFPAAERPDSFVELTSERCEVTGNFAQCGLCISSAARDQNPAEGVRNAILFERIGNRTLDRTIWPRGYAPTGVWRASDLFVEQ